MTKNVLKEGIKTYELVELWDDTTDLKLSDAVHSTIPGYLRVMDKSNLIGPDDWFTTEADARKRAREIVKRKISATEKLLARLRALDTSLA